MDLLGRISSGHKVSWNGRRNSFVLLDPVHSHTFTFVNAYFLILLHIASTRKRRFKLS